MLHVMCSVHVSVLCVLFMLRCYVYCSFYGVICSVHVTVLCGLFMGLSQSITGPSEDRSRVMIVAKTVNPTSRSQDPPQRDTVYTREKHVKWATQISLCDPSQTTPVSWAQKRPKVEYSKLTLKSKKNRSAGSVHFLVKSWQKYLEMADYGSQQAGLV